MNTIRDLLAVEVDLKELLPEDLPAPHGFENDGLALRVSSVLIERYMEACRRGPEGGHRSRTEAGDDQGQILVQERAALQPCENGKDRCGTGQCGCLVER